MQEKPIIDLKYIPHAGWTTIGRPTMDITGGASNLVRSPSAGLMEDS
jgi:hypothetical protein